MKLVTPSKGTIEVSKEKDPELFYLARCGLGGLGVVAEVTLQCVERLQLVEHTYVSNLKEIKKNHKYMHFLTFIIESFLQHSNSLKKQLKLLRSLKLKSIINAV